MTADGDDIVFAPLGGDVVDHVGVIYRMRPCRLAPWARWLFRHEPEHATIVGTVDLAHPTGDAAGITRLD